MVNREKKRVNKRAFLVERSQQQRLVGLRLLCWLERQLKRMRSRQPLQETVV